MSCIPPLGIAYGPTMDSEFVVRSNHGGDQLRVCAVNPGDQWRAKIDFGDLKAEAKLYERYSGDALRLDAYFGELASSGRGWEGDIEWEALGLRLAARHDGLAHVTCDATLDEDLPRRRQVAVRASLTLDAGSLDRLAAEARVLDAR
jgi:hypothetical protein